MEGPQQIVDTMTALIQLMVHRLEEIRIETLPTSEGAILKVSLAPTDVGKLIGTDGRTARSLRVILEAISKSTNKRSNLISGYDFFKAARCFGVSFRKTPPCRDRSCSPRIALDASGPLRRLIESKLRID